MLVLVVLRVDGGSDGSDGGGYKGVRCGGGGRGVLVNSEGQPRCGYGWGGYSVVVLIEIKIQID